MTVLSPQTPNVTGQTQGEGRRERPRWTKQYHLTGSILVIKDNLNSASGFIAFGSSYTNVPKTASSGSGVYIDYSGIYGLASGTKQFYLQSSDGKAYAGAGAVVLDVNGVTLAESTGVPSGASTANVNWAHSWLNSTYESGVPLVTVSLFAGGPTLATGDAKIVLTAMDSAAASITLTLDTVADLITLGGDTAVSGHLTMANAKNIVVNTSTGTKIGTATGQKLGFWDATPVVQQVLATGAAHTVDDVITFLQTVGLCKQS